MQSRPFTPQEASPAAASTCNLGLECWPARWPSVSSPEPPDSFLIDHQLVTAFEVGWSVLHQDVSGFVAQQLIAMLDMTAWTSVLGLLDECPELPAALTAILEGRTTSVSPTAFDFISTAAQIGDVRVFMRKLPEVLSG